MSKNYYAQVQAGDPLATPPITSSDILRKYAQATSTSVYHDPTPSTTSTTSTNSQLSDSSMSQLSSTNSSSSSISLAATNASEENQEIDENYLGVTTADQDRCRSIMSTLAMTESVCRDKKTNRLIMIYDEAMDEIRYRCYVCSQPWHYNHVCSHSPTLPSHQLPGNNNNTNTPALSLSKPNQSSSSSSSSNQLSLQNSNYSGF